MAPLEEVDYTSQDQIAHMNGDATATSSNEGLSGHQGPDSMTSDLHRQLLNIPMTSEGSHDSHNDSGYSTRLGFSAGPSPSLSGTCGMEGPKIEALYLKLAIANALRRTHFSGISLFPLPLPWPLIIRSMI